MVDVELIPVIEVLYSNKAVDRPNQIPYWEHPDLWQDYRDKCYTYAGFVDQFIPISKGSGFYRPKDISTQNLIKIIQDYIDSYIKLNTDEPIIPLSGGFVLQINGQNELYPQCCSDLGEWAYWYSIAIKYCSFYSEGHPAPCLQFAKDQIVFDCESFVPNTKKRLKVDPKSLSEAFEKMMIELKEFGDRVDSLSQQISFESNTETLSYALIYRNENLDSDDDYLKTFIA